MRKICLIFSDQLSDCLSSLKLLDKNDVVLICELFEEFTYVKHHPKKIAFQLATMRHFAIHLEKLGYNIRYVKLIDHENTGSFYGEVKRAMEDFSSNYLVVTQPCDYRLKIMLESLIESLQIKAEILSDDRFLCSINEFKIWVKDRKQLRMEYFYREMRKRYNILIEKNDKPTGGLWNYDKENRQPPNINLKSPKRISHKKSDILLEVLQLVSEKFSNHFGDLLPFYYAVTREQALIELDDFIDNILLNFGEHQDAMLMKEPYLNHSLLSSYINAGLLLPLEICKKAENAYRSGKVPLNAAEGFIRQILGWREYVRGIYWLYMPEYGDLNYLQAYNPLPDFYWGGKTNMSCLTEVVSQTREHAYSHHIQRLMITGNFALIAGLDVAQVQDWYLAVYSDAYEWVEMPNTLGMALYGDGGILGSKPYAASGKYINRMSNFCKSCPYNPEDTLGDKACPFNSLYWAFIARNRQKLESNQRMRNIYYTWDKFDEAKQEAIISKALSIIKEL